MKKRRSSKNGVLAAAKALRAERKSELAVGSRIPSPSNPRVSDRVQVPPERFGSCSKRGPFQEGPESKEKRRNEPLQPPPPSPPPLAPGQQQPDEKLQQREQLKATPPLPSLPPSPPPHAKENVVVVEKQRLRNEQIVVVMEMKGFDKEDGEQKE